MYKEYEVIMCECKHICPIEFTHIGEDGNYTCPNCVIEELIPDPSLVEALELFINAGELSDEGYIITASVWDGLVENAKMVIKKNKNR